MLGARRIDGELVRCEAVIVDTKLPPPIRASRPASRARFAGSSAGQMPTSSESLGQFERSLNERGRLLKVLAKVSAPVDAQSLAPRRLVDQGVLLRIPC
jgi:hypothetical protein